MRRITFLVLLLAAASGCAASQTSRPAPVAQAAEVETDPSWNPPSEMEMSIGDSTRNAPKTQTAVDAVHIPKQEKPRGTVHAATY